MVATWHDGTRPGGIEAMGGAIRVGAVSYLNAKPLYYRLAEFAPGSGWRWTCPSRLADRLARGSWTWR